MAKPEFDPLLTLTSYFLKKEESIMKRIKFLLLLLISGVFFCFNAHAATIILPKNWTVV